MERSRTLDEKIYSSSDTEEDLFLPSTSKNYRKYTQKFRESWRDDPRLSNWIVAVNENEVECKYCHRIIKCKLSCLLSHGKTSKHIAAASTWETNAPKALELQQTHQPEECDQQEEYSSSDTKEDLFLPNARKRKHAQKPGKGWFRDPRFAEWIIQINDKKVKCKYCHSLVKSKSYNLLRHTKTSKHLIAASSINNNNNNKKALKLRPKSMSSLNPDLSKPTCRVCLQNNDGEMSSIFDVDADADFNDLHIYEKIEQCAGIKVLRHEQMPTLICGDCYGFLKVSYKFRTICRNSNEYLKEFVVVGEDNKNIEISPKGNPLSLSENSLKKEDTRSQHKTRLAENLSSQSLDIKIEEENVGPPNSPKDSENLIDYNFDEDADEIWFDIACHDEDDISCGENVEASIEEIGVDIKNEPEELNQIKKVVKRIKKSTAKKKKSIIASKTLEISSDGAAIIREKRPVVKRVKKENQPHICEICGNIYQRRYSLELHARRHRAEKPYECEICGYAFHSNFELIRHMRKHTGSKPYKCSYCARAFGDQSTLIKHERIHRNERPFKCETCGKSFTYSNVLKYHKYVHTGEKPYTCGLCGKSFTRPHHLRAHLETLQHQSDPRSKILLQNIRKNNEDETLKLNTSILKI